MYGSGDVARGKYDNTEVEAGTLQERVITKTPE